MRALAVFFLLCFSVSVFSQQSQSPILSGYVTRAASGSDFDVNGIRVLCGAETRIESPAGDSYYGGCFEKTPIIGLGVDVYGQRKKKLNAVAAERIDVKRIAHEEIAGMAVIDGVLEAQAPGAVRVRADGYPILITAQTAVTIEAPLQSLSDVMPNVWMEYRAKPGAGGEFGAESAKFAQNMITEKEDAMRTKAEYDPAAVPTTARPDRTARALGMPVDPKSIPPWPDPAAQARLTTIGEKLVPAYQRGLAANDPSRIHFRFQLTDGKQWPWVLALPSGIVLVPDEVVERMENDSELAEILADAIACVLEKQTYRMRIAERAMRAGSMAQWAEFVPVIGLPVALAGVGSQAGEVALIRKEEHQSERVSLWLMHDAGYDVDEAPVAWWLLASRKPKPVAEIAMPDRSAYLYRVLAEEWAR